MIKGFLKFALEKISLGARRILQQRCGELQSPPLDIGRVPKDLTKYLGSHTLEDMKVLATTTWRALFREGDKPCPAALPCHPALPPCHATLPCHPAMPPCPALPHGGSSCPA